MPNDKLTGAAMRNLKVSLTDVEKIAIRFLCGGQLSLQEGELARKGILDENKALGKLFVKRHIEISILEKLAGKNV